MTKVYLRNEQQEPLISTDVEMYDLRTGRVVKTVQTNKEGIVEFDADPKTHGFRPLITRNSGKSGKMALNGAVHVTLEPIRPVETLREITKTTLLDMVIYESSGLNIIGVDVDSAGQAAPGPITVYGVAFEADLDFVPTMFLLGVFIDAGTHTVGFEFGSSGTATLVASSSDHYIYTITNFVYAGGELDIGVVIDGAEVSGAAALFAVRDLTTVVQAGAVPLAAYAAGSAGFQIYALQSPAAGPANNWGTNLNDGGDARTIGLASALGGGHFIYPPGGDFWATALNPPSTSADQVAGANGAGIAVEIGT